MNGNRTGGKTVKLNNKEITKTVYSTIYSKIDDNSIHGIH